LQYAGCAILCRFLLTGTKCPFARPAARSAALSSPAYELTPFAPWGRRLHLENAEPVPTGGAGSGADRANGI